MAGMQDTKRRIHSVQSTRKITNAMELVASAKLRRARERYNQSREYFETIETDIADIIANSSTNDNPYTSTRENGKTLYIVITSDLGLCGGYNANIYKLVRDHIKEDAEFIVLGNKGVSYFRNKHANVLKSLSDSTAHPEYKTAQMVGELVLKRFLSGEVKEIKIAYTKFINSVSFDARFQTILPITVDNENTSKALVEYEPSAEALLDMLIPRYVSSCVFGYMIESLVSEQANRRLAMENATDNADELIDLLKLEYNRARQASITQEISEIVAGANAI